MTAARIYTLFLLILICGIASAQEEIPPSEPVEAPDAAQPALRKVRLTELESLSLMELRKQFSRPVAIMTQTNSYRIPDYGPMLNITLQLPPIYFTAPIMKKLEEASRRANEQAGQIKVQIDHAAQIIRMKAREAELIQQIDFQQSQKKAKATVISLQSELENVRKNITDLETGSSVSSVPSTHFEMQLDLEKMMADNYQEAIHKIAAAMQNVMVDQAINLDDLQSTERICIAAHVRENFLIGQERTILFILNPSDIDDYRSGRIDRAGLRRKIVVKEQAKD